jgi:hypothetical protein
MVFKQPRIAFCTTCKGRAQHIVQTLSNNLADNTGYDNAVFVVLDYSGNDDLKSLLLETYPEYMESGRLVVYTHYHDQHFHMAHAKNMAHRCGILEGADILVNLDADGFTGPDFANYIADKFSNNKSIFLQAMWNRWVERNGAEEWLTQEPSGEYGPPVPKGCNGRFVLSTEAFIKSGGYDEKYSTWGPDDKDLNIRLRRLGYVPELIERKHLNTILHNDKVRFREYPQARHLKGYEFHITVHDSPDTIANFGHIGKGQVYRNNDLVSITLGPIPTRIFGIGMHKTGTTSLDVALKTLGIESGHWITAHWAKAIWREMNSEGKSPTLEKHYAVSDLPIPLLYKKLDVAYPGSKFILTTRNEVNWLDSVQRHWSYSDNKYRSAWDSDPFTHRIHKVLYGRTEFDAAVFLERFKRHNNEVKDYFKDRPNDLLIMDLDINVGWNALCNFLHRPIPMESYPICRP